MPRGLVKINTARLRDAAAELANERNAAAAQRAIIQNLENLRNRWKHVDSDTFMFRLSELQRDMLELEETMQAYINALNNGAITYEQAQRDVLSTSRNISGAR